MGNFHIYTALLGISISFIIMLRGFGFEKANFYMGFYFFLISSLLLVFSFGFKNSPLFWTAILMGNGMPIMFLVGPFAFFYIRSILTDNAKLSKLDYLHFAMFLIQILAMSPHYFSSFEHKLQIAQTFQMGDARNLSLHLSLIPPTFNTWMSITHLFIYIVWNAFYFINFYRKKGLKLFNNLSFRLAKVWLFFFYGTTLLLFNNSLFLAISQLKETSRSAFEKSNPSFISYTGIFLILNMLVLLLLPEIMYGIPRIKAQELAKKTTLPDIEPKQVEIPKKEEKINTALLHFPEIEEKLNAIVLHSNSFLDENFTIYKLAMDIDVPVHHLRFYFKSRGVSFTSFKNRHRIKYAKELLKKAEHKKYNIEGIGELAGFSSSASFYTEFKKETGLSPAEYAKNHLN